MDGRAFSFCVSRDIDLPVRIKICTLEGGRPRKPYSELVSNPNTISAINGDSNDLMVTVQLYANSKPLTVPMNTLYKPYRSLNRRWNEWITLPIKYSQLPFDAQLAITIWDCCGKETRIPYGGTTIRLFEKDDCTLKRGRQKCKVWLDCEADGLSETNTDSTVKSVFEMDRLERLIKSHEAGDMVRIGWLDNLAFRQIERVNKLQMASTNNKEKNDEHYLFIELVQFDFPVVFSDMEYPTWGLSSTHQQLPGPVAALDEATNTRHSTNSGIMIVHDPEQSRENPIESKYRRLVRSHKSGPLDKELKPNAKIRDELNLIMNFSPVQELTDDEKNLLWKFRYYLTRHKQALTKFLKSITWEDQVEAKEAVELLPKWAEVDIADALELLGPIFKNQKVRSYAVDRLRKANDTELELYLLQLVEALKFEPRSSNNKKTSDLARFLITRAARNPKLGNFFYWYVSVGSQEKGPEGGELFKPILTQFTTALNEQQPDGEQRAAVLKSQIKFMDKLLEISVKIKQSKATQQKKIEVLRTYMAESKHGFLSFSAIPLPLDPSVMICGCVPDDCSVFKSSLSPLKITLKTQDGGTYPIMFKSGDDLRQDQLVIQIINLMDQLLQNENLDLRLKPYRILATGVKDGALQFIPNQTLSHVLSEYHGILPYLRQHNPDNNSTGVKAEVMDTFVRSCAGYCVITYLLGVGDRHLDNLLITPDGHFFHADFGYILGRDPKPFPPMMKLPIQVIDGMGGAQSANYERFRSYCFTAFTSLRKNSNLILNLFALMTESSIPDIQFEKDKAVHKVKEKFCLEMTEAEAMLHFQNLINDSVNAFLPVVIDRLHSLAQYWRG